MGAVKYFLFSLDPSLKSKVAFVGATSGSSEKTYLRVAETKVSASPSVPFWRIDLKSALAGGASTTIAVEVVLGGALEMYPAAITQKEKQLARFNGNLYCYLAYPVTTQTTTVSLASSNIESHTKTKPVSVSDSIITYGPHKNTPAFSSADLTVHSENNSPMLVVSSLSRLIEVSMWGNLAIEETIDVVHRGAQLKVPQIKSETVTLTSRTFSETRAHSPDTSSKERTVGFQVSRTSKPCCLPLPRTFTTGTTLET